MNITRESTGELTAVVRIEIGPSDYSEAVDKQIADYKKKANIPGFRPGHVPTGLIKKMYGKAILAEEVNKLLSDGLMNYIKEEKLDILGNPIPNPEKNSSVDFEIQSVFDFYFDLGMTPEFKIPFDKDLEIENYSIIIDDEMVNKYIEDTRKRYGKPIEKVSPPSEIPVDDAASSENSETKTDPQVEPAEMTPEFFNLVYPGMNLQTEDEFREQVRKDAGGSFIVETDKLLFHTITETLINKTELSLPDDFLKRWLLENNEGKYTPEEIEKNYPSFVESMKWQLIENKLIKENNIQVTDENIRNYIRTVMLRQVNSEGMDPEMQKRYDSIIDTFMQNKEQVQRINDQLYNAKLMDLFKSNLTLNTKEVTFDEYAVIASSKNRPENGHEHEHEHEHDHQH